MKKLNKNFRILKATVESMEDEACPSCNTGCGINTCPGDPNAKSFAGGWIQLEIVANG